MQKYQRGLAFARNGVPVISKEVLKPEAPAWVRLDTPLDEAEKQHLQHHAKHAAYHAKQQERKRRARFDGLQYTK